MNINKESGIKFPFRVFDAVFYLSSGHRAESALKNVDTVFKKAEYDFAAAGEIGFNVVFFEQQQGFFVLRLGRRACYYCVFGRCAGNKIDKRAYVLNVRRDFKKVAGEVVFKRGKLFQSFLFGIAGEKSGAAADADHYCERAVVRGVVFAVFAFLRRVYGYFCISPRKFRPGGYGFGFGSGIIYRFKICVVFRAVFTLKRCVYLANRQRVYNLCRAADVIFIEMRYEKTVDLSYAVFSRQSAPRHAGASPQ